MTTTKTKSKSPTSKAKFDLPEKSKADVARAKRILDGLYKEYPDAHCELDYTNAHELLIATILSAQATDVGVNKATPGLFKAYPTPGSIAKTTPAKIETYIKTIGLFRNKAKFVQGAMKSVVENFNGEVPQTMRDLISLPGVARKTANVVLGNAFDINVGVVVDTHVIRLSQRFGLSEHTDAKKIEKDLMALFPRAHWTMLSHLLIWHGRRACKARGAMCADHPLCKKYCSNAKGGA
ncbi:MAG: endonuclease III [Planctomycetota bacterium]|nr:endonuclease III [Planctomycetota bacterium]